MRSVVIFTLAAALAGCGSSNTTGTGTTGPDASVSPDVVATPDTTPAADVPATTNVYPPGPYGSRTCARFEPFTLNTCDGEPWRFNQDDFFASTATVVIIGAGWCVPCQNEARQIETELGPYRDRGVRVVQVLVQNPDRTAITPAFCNTWRTRYGLTIPELMDPEQALQPYYPGLAFPGNLIVDRRGVIRYRAYGTETGLTAIKRALDDVLANPDTCTP